MKEALRKIRNHRLVLTPLVHLLQAAQRFDYFRSARFYQHVPYRGCVKVDISPGQSFRIVSHGDHIENSLFWEGIFAHEPVSMRKWISIAQGAKSVIDVGANSGVFALAAAAVGAERVYAFEPLPRVYDILKGNLAANHFSGLSAWQVAVSDAVGVADLFDPGGNAPTSASLSREFTKSHFGAGLPAIRVPVTTLDAFCAEQGVARVDLIKIDVEGHEEAALRGMVETVRRDKPAILMEVLDEYDAHLRNVVTELFGRDYQWQRVDEGNAKPNRNVLLIPAQS